MRLIIFAAVVIATILLLITIHIIDICHSLSGESFKIKLLDSIVLLVIYTLLILMLYHLFIYLPSVL